MDIKKLTAATIFSLVSVFALSAQTIKELDTKEKHHSVPDFEITYDNGDKAYVDMHLLTYPDSEATVGFLAGFIPENRREASFQQFMKAAPYAGPAAKAFNLHIKEVHLDELELNAAEFDVLVEEVRLRGTARLQGP